MGFPSVWAKFKLPYYFMMALAYCCSAVGWLFGIRFEERRTIYASSPLCRLTSLYLSLSLS
jgi:hypothetical protein